MNTWPTETFQEPVVHGDTNKEPDGGEIYTSKLRNNGQKKQFKKEGKLNRASAGKQGDEKHLQLPKWKIKNGFQYLTALTSSTTDEQEVNY